MPGRPLRVATVNLQHGTPAQGDDPRPPADASPPPDEALRAPADALRGSRAPGETARMPAEGAHGRRALAETSAALVAAGRALAALDLDVVALQEVDRNQRRSRYVDQARVLARMLGMPWWRLAAAEIGPRGGPRMRSPLPAVSWGPAYGVALLSRLPVRGWHVWSFPGALRVLGHDHPLAAGGPVLRLGPVTVRRDEPRVALAAEIDGPFGPLAVAATHLSTDGAASRAQLASIAERLGRLPGAHVLAGDLNLLPDDVAGALAATVRPGGPPHDGPGRGAPAPLAVGERPGALAPLAVGATFPAHAPRRQIDHVLGSPGLTATGAEGDPRGTTGEVHRLPVADHLTLVARIIDQRAGDAT
ncbi:MAG: endonuclease/exonuclease/phosphatase family protein [Actinomycetales bacterium]